MGMRVTSSGCEKGELVDGSAGRCGRPQVNSMTVVQSWALRALQYQAAVNMARTELLHG